jgi:hypothetical protein
VADGGIRRRISLAPSEQMAITHIVAGTNLSRGGRKRMQQESRVYPTIGSWYSVAAIAYSLLQATLKMYSQPRLQIQAGYATLLPMGSIDVPVPRMHGVWVVWVGRMGMRGDGSHAADEQAEHGMAAPK